MPNQINRPPNKQNPVMTMITRGRRALGEEWSKVSIYPDPDTGAYLIDREETEAPPDNTAIFVPGLGNISIEMADFILERERDKARDRAKVQKRSQAEIAKELNEAWQEYMQQKIAHFKGRTSLGPGGFFQRERSLYRHGR